MSPTINVSDRGVTASVDYGTTTPPPSDYPAYQYATLYKTGDTFADVLRTRIPVPRAYVQLPSGFAGELVDFTDTNHYSLYAPKCMGIWGPTRNPADAIIRLKPSSSTQVALIPKQGSNLTQPLTLMRLGPSNSSTPTALHCWGWTLEGTDQAVDPNTGQPHVYGGFSDYWTVGSVFEDMRFLGIPSSWNSPPGECAQLACYRSDGSVIRRVEVDGYNRAGRQVGGGVGGAAAGHTTWEDCNFHDSFTSGFAFGVAGSAGPGSMCTGLTTRRVRLTNQSNHSTGGGRTFAGINHEGVNGYIRHEDLTVQMTPGNTREHLGFRNGLQDCPEVTVNGIAWANGPASAKGLLVVAVPAAYSGSSDGLNKQTTLPIIRAIKDGPILTPVTSATGADPAKNYLLTR